MINALTFDWEDWYQVTNFDSVIGFNNWPKYESRLENSTQRLLSLLKRANVKATFFVLGWNAEKFSHLVQQIHEEGHEIGTHGYSHKLIYTQRPGEFANELKKSIDIIEKITKDQVIGHIAASFSIVKKCFWAFKILQNHGIKYDCSIFPIKHPVYGVPDSPRFPYLLDMAGGNGSLIEFPCSTISLFGLNIPFSGGGYFRLLPYLFLKIAIKYINAQSHPVIIYLHPWEMDPDQPQQNINRINRFRHYVNLHTTEKKLAKLLEDFEFAPTRDVLSYLNLLKDDS